MAKRAATSALNQDNWDKEEEEVEEPGVFQSASSDILQSRVIKTAKRRIRMSENNSEGKPSPFSGFSGFSSGKATATSSFSSPFSFLNQEKNNVCNDKDNKILGATMRESSLQSTDKKGLPPFSSMEHKDTSEIKASSPATDSTFKPFEHIFKAKAKAKAEAQAQRPGNEKKKSDDLELLRDLNLSCSSWISEHLEKNPYCILTPIFKDYEKHLNELNLKLNDEKGREEIDVNDGNKRNDKQGDGILEKPLTCGISNSFTSSKTGLENDSESSKLNKIEKDNKKANEFKLGGFQSMKPFNFQFGSVNTTFESNPTSLSLNEMGNQSGNLESESKKYEEESEEPPKNDFVPVVEEDSIFDMKCKVFVKKEGSFVSRGVGTLFLKPVQGSGKTQAVVRAHTNLGNILLNIILSADMPIQKTGKNNAMLVCVPTPESKPPPVPVLIRVKTIEECDLLIKKLNECKAS